jgi:hypothetical protein
MTDSNSTDGKKRFRKLPDEAEVQRLLASGPNDMTMWESAIYIAGYCAGYDAAGLEESQDG